MVPAEVRGEERAKPVWGSPPAASGDRPSKADEARAAREQAKAARAEAKAARTARRQGRSTEKAAVGSRPTRAAAPRAGAGAGKGGAASARTPTRPAKPTGTRRGRPAARAGGAKRAAPAKRSRASAFRQRYVVVHDLEGPRVRLGIGWFALALVGVVGGTVSTALVYGSAAAIAAAQTARVWRKRRARPNEAMAAGGVGLAAAGACFGAGGAGLGLLGAVGLAYVGAAGDTGSRNPRLADVGWTLQTALPPAAVALSMVLLARMDQGSAIALLLLVSAFEAGDFLIGSGAQNPYEGPAAGAAGIVVITFIVSTLPVSTLSFGQAWLLGGAVAVLAPVGQLLASALLPSATAPASALRRLDSLLIAAPLWAWAVGIFS